jgi:glycosyltransferase involved in cell wall biosynthesis
VPRIAVVAQGDVTDPGVWSGSPVGLCSGLIAAGVEVVPVDARPPGSSRLTRLLRISWEREAANPVLGAASGWWGAACIRRAGRIDGAVSIGSGYILRTGVPNVTFEDMTVAQGLLQPHSAVSGLGERAVRRWRERQRRVYARSRACCVGSNWTAGSIRDDYGIDPGKIHVVGFGRNFEPLPVDRDWRVPRFLFLGVEWERKRGPAVLDAFAEVRALHPEATFDVVGEHPPLDAAGVTGHGRLALGSPEDRKRLTELLAQSTCLVLPSAFEAFGIAYVDAGAAGVPSIGTTVGGAPDAIGDGGVLVEPDDPRALAAAMLGLADPDTARRLGELAFAHSALFTWRAVAERVIRALRPPGVDLDRLAGFLDPS